LRCDDGTVFGPFLYNGTFANGKPDRYGIFFDPKTHKKVYEGSHLDGIYYGQGILYNDEQVLYKGYFSQGKYDGEGVLYDSQGDILYQGSFFNGLYEGEGIDYSNKEKKNFSRGKPVETKSKPRNVTFPPVTTPQPQKIPIVALMDHYFPEFYNNKKLYKINLQISTEENANQGSGNVEQKFLEANLHRGIENYQRILEGRGYGLTEINGGFSLNYTFIDKSSILIRGKMERSKFSSNLRISGPKETVDGTLFFQNNDI